METALAVVAVVGVLVAAALGVMVVRLLGERARLAGELEVQRVRGEEVEKLRAAAEAGAAQERRVGEELAGLRERLAAAERARGEAVASAERLGAERAGALEMARKQIEASSAQFRDQAQAVFKSLAATAMDESAKTMLALAKQTLGAQQAEAAKEASLQKSAVEKLVSPIAETLRKTEEKLAAMEQQRAGAFGEIKEQMKQVGEMGQQLRVETSKLVRALREPHVRGRYGELQLKRVAELAGMTGYCDFATQDSTTDAEGNALRPDMVVRLPGGRCVVVDAKTNIQGYLEALEAGTAEAAEAAMERYAGHVEKQTGLLAKKKYWSQYEGSPEFVVMFVPGDQFLDAALARRPELLEVAWRQNVILASPTTLIGLLRAVAVGYGEERLAKEAEEFRQLARELHARAVTAMEHVAGLGASLGRAVEKYNEFLSSYRTRLEPQLRRLQEAEMKGPKMLPEIGEIEVRPGGVVGKVE